jgi:hypothetical protein
MSSNHHINNENIKKIMNKNLRIVIFATLLLAVFSIHASAQNCDKPNKVKFGKKKTSATVYGTKPVYYEFRAKRGQKLTVTPKPNATAIEFYAACQPIAASTSGIFTYVLLEDNLFEIVARPPKDKSYTLTISIK